MNQTNVRVRYLDLEAANADAETVSALVGIVSQVQSGKPLPVVTAASVETFVDPSEPRALPAAKVRKPREPKAPKERVSKGKRAAGLTPAIKTAVAASGGDKPDYNAIAKEVYGNSSADSVGKVKRAFWSLCDRGTLKKLGEDSYKVVG
jgi:hypothetical protein